MSEPGSFGMRTSERRGSDGLAGAILLGTKEMRRGRVTYPFTGLFMLFLGFLMVPSLSGVFELRG